MKKIPNIATTMLSIAKTMVPASEIRFLVSAISSISNRVVSSLAYIFSIVSLSSRFFIYATILYGDPIAKPISASFSRTTDSGRTSQKPGKSLSMVVIVPVIGSATWLDDWKILDFPKVNSIFCHLRKKSFICGNIAELPANCVLYRSIIVRESPTGICHFWLCKAESVTEKTGISLSRAKLKNPNFALTGMLTRRKTWVFSRRGFSRISVTFASVIALSELKIFKRFADTEIVTRRSLFPCPE